MTISPSGRKIYRLKNRYRASRPKITQFHETHFLHILYRNLMTYQSVLLLSRVQHRNFVKASHFICINFKQKYVKFLQLQNINLPARPSERVSMHME